MIATPQDRISVRANDVTGQRSVRARNVDPLTTIGALTTQLVARMDLVQEGSGGRPLNYAARLEREGRLLHPSERVADVLAEDDQLMLAPSIEAGAT